ncbi:MAG: hypothetical protein JWO13_1691 [Acidobacteriales bacterium]|nr:hypothetical protein [Terriglobales bacterium]
MYKGSVIDDLIQSVVQAEQHIESADSIKKSRPNVQAYAMYMYEYYRPETAVSTGAFEVA